MAAEDCAPVGELQGNSSDRPLSGSSLLIVVGEIFSDEHKGLVFERIAKGLKTWDKECSGCDINQVLFDISAESPEPALSDSGEALIECFPSEHVSVSVLVNPQLETFQSKLQNILTSQRRYRHLVFAGHTFSGSGNWIFQDDSLSFAKFVAIIGSVSESLNTQDGGTLCINAVKDGDWSDGNLAKQMFAKSLKVKLNPDSKLEDTQELEKFAAYLSPLIQPQPVRNMLKASNIVGNIRFSRPTMYMFPGGQGDSALFGVSGFNLLMNAGYSRKSNCWDFTRHLDRIDAMFLSHLNEDNLFGVSSILQRKVEESLHPEIGCVYFNGQEKHKHSPNGDLDAEHGGIHKEASLTVDLIEEGHKMMQNMHTLAIKPEPCIGKIQGSALQPVNLYHKVGQGSLDVYFLNPQQDSKDLKEFMSHWNKHGGSFPAKGGIPLPNMAGVSSLLVWKPSSADDKITRILFPGSVPQSKLFEGLDKLKNMNIFQHAVCTDNSLKAPAVSKVKKSHAGKVTPVHKSPPSASPKTTPRGSVKSIPDKVKNTSTRPTATKSSEHTSSATKVTKEPIKKAQPPKEVKKTTKPAAKTDKTKTEKAEKLKPAIQKPEVISPAESSGTQESGAAISDASSSDLAQTAAALKEELSSRDEFSPREQSPMVEHAPQPPVDVDDVQPTIDELTPENSEEGPNSVEAEPKQEQQMEEEFEGHFAQHEQADDYAQFRNDYEEEPEDHDVEKQPQEFENQNLEDFGQEEENVHEQDMDYPEPLPYPQQFDHSEPSEEPWADQLKARDDEKDVDTCEAEGAEIKRWSAGLQDEEEVSAVHVEDVHQSAYKFQYEAEERFEAEESGFQESAAPDLLVNNGHKDEDDQQQDDQYGYESERSDDGVSGMEQPDLLMSAQQDQYQDYEDDNDSHERLVDPDDVQMSEDKDAPFNGARPEGLPSPWDVHEVIPDEIGDVHDLPYEAVKENLEQEQKIVVEASNLTPDDSDVREESLIDFAAKSDDYFPLEKKNIMNQFTSMTGSIYVPQEEADEQLESSSKPAEPEQDVAEDIQTEDKVSPTSEHNDQPDLIQICRPDLVRQEDDIDGEMPAYLPSETQEDLVDEPQPAFCDDSINFGGDDDVNELSTEQVEQSVPYGMKGEEEPEMESYGDKVSSVSEPENCIYYEPDIELRRSPEHDIIDLSPLEQNQSVEFVAPPECDLYSSTTAFESDSPKEPIEHVQPSVDTAESDDDNERFEGQMFRGAAVHDREFLPGDMEPDIPSAFESEEPSKATSEEKDIGAEFDPVREWGLPMGLPAPTAGNGTDKKAENIEAKEGDKKQATAKTAKTRPATAPAGAKMNASRLNASMTAAKKAAANSSNDAAKKAADSNKAAAATKKPASSSGSKLNTTTTKKAGGLSPRPTPAPKENGAKTEGAKTEHKKSAALDRTIKKKEQVSPPAPQAHSTAKKPTSTVQKTPGVAKSLDITKPAPKHDVAKSLDTTKPAPKHDISKLDTSRMEKLETSRLDAGKPASRTIGTKRPATAPASRPAVPVKLQPVNPFYCDLAYIPYHGDSHYMTMDFFRRVRARYYVYSALQPNPEVFDLLMEAKKTWGEEGCAEVTVIPTYDNDAVRAWMRLNNERLGELKVDIAPSACRCTIQLQDPDTSCAAFRLEF